MNTNNNSIDASQLIDERPMSRTQVLVAALCAVAILIDGYGLQVMALTVPTLAHEWGMSPARFSVALSAVLFGLGASAAVVAPLGDKLGRRPMVLVAMLIIGMATLATATATNPTQFVIWRFLTGFGIGISVPNCNAWTAEYSPARRRSTILVLINAAVGVGAFSAGYIVPPVLEHWGWRGTFVIGGAVSLLLAVVMFLTAPESVKLLLSRERRDVRIAAILKRIAPGVDPERVRHGTGERRAVRRSVLELLGTVYRARTLVLWSLIAVNLFTLYVLISWLPTLLQAAGWQLAQAVRAAVLIQAGGVIGGIVLSFSLDRGQTRPALFGAFLIAAACLALFGAVPSGAGWSAMLLLIGCGVSGPQLSLNALATAYYPPAIKATGMAWAGVVGTVGSIIAPLAGGQIIEAGFTPVTILVALSLGPVVCAGGVLLMRREWQE